MADITTDITIPPTENNINNDDTITNTINGAFQHQQQQQSINDVNALNETLYVNNLNEKIKVPELKKQLYNMFSQFGRIIDVIASRTVRTRGQAWIVFQDKPTAAMAKKKMDGTMFYDKPMRIQFAKTKSDAIASLDGSVQRQKQERAERRKQYELQKKRGLTDTTSEERPAKRQRTTKNVLPGVTTTASSGVMMAPERTMALNEPNKILFIENLPANADKETTESLFKNFAGFKEIRIIPGKGLAFAEYDNEVLAGSAMSQLQGYRLAEQPLKITFAKK